MTFPAHRFINFFPPGNIGSLSMWDEGNPRQAEDEEATHDRCSPLISAQYRTSSPSYKRASCRRGAALLAAGRDGDTANKRGGKHDKSAYEHPS
jgi:hypothetical protein